MTLAVNLHQLSYYDASQECFNGGGRLVALKTAARQAEVIAALHAAGITQSWVWVGANDIATEGTWIWSDGTGVSYPGAYTRWQSGEPNDARQSEDCMGLITSSGLWNDWSCSHALISVCEGAAFPPSAPPPPPSPPKPPPPSPPPGTHRWLLNSQSDWHMCFTSNGAFARVSCDSTVIQGHIGIRVSTDPHGGGHTVRLQAISFSAPNQLVWDVDLGMLVGGACLYVWCMRGCTPLLAAC